MAKVCSAAGRSGEGFLGEGLGKNQARWLGKVVVAQVRRQSNAGECGGRSTGVG